MSHPHGIECGGEGRTGSVPAGPTRDAALVCLAAPVTSRQKTAHCETSCSEPQPAWTLHPLWIPRLTSVRALRWGLTRIPRDPRLRLGREGPQQSLREHSFVWMRLCPHQVPVGHNPVAPGLHGAALLLLLLLSLLLLQARARRGWERVGSCAGQTGRVRGIHPVTPPGTGPSSRPVCLVLICLSLLSGPAPALLQHCPYHPTQETRPSSWGWGSFHVAPFQSVGSHLSAAGSVQTAPHPFPPRPRMPGLDPGSDTGRNSSSGIKNLGSVTWESSHPWLWWARGTRRFA